MEDRDVFPKMLERISTASVKPEEIEYVTHRM